MYLYGNQSRIRFHIIILWSKKASNQLGSLMVYHDVLIVSTPVPVKLHAHLPFLDSSKHLKYVSVYYVWLEFE